MKRSQAEMNRKVSAGESTTSSDDSNDAASKRRIIEAKPQLQSTLPTPPLSLKASSPQVDHRAAQPTYSAMYRIPSPVLAPNGVVTLLPDHSYDELPCFQAYLACLGSPSKTTVPWHDSASPEVVRQAVRNGVESLLEWKQDGKGLFLEPSNDEIPLEFVGLPWLASLRERLYREDIGQLWSSARDMSGNVEDVQRGLLRSNVYNPPPLPGLVPPLDKLDPRTTPWMWLACELYTLFDHPLGCLLQCMLKSRRDEESVGGDTALEYVDEDSLSRFPGAVSESEDESVSGSEDEFESEPEDDGAVEYDDDGGSGDSDPGSRMPAQGDDGTVEYDAPQATAGGPGVESASCSSDPQQPCEGQWAFLLFERDLGELPDVDQLRAMPVFTGPQPDA